MAPISPHAWLRPRLVALVAEAEAAGIARDVSVAVITDLINGALSAETPAASGDNPDQDIGEPDYMANQGTGAHPTVPQEQVSEEVIRQPLGIPGRHW